MNELKFVEYLKKTIKPGGGIVRGIGDDAAVIRYTGKKYLLFASDMLIEGAHFRKNTPPEKIGWKSVAVNISDIAAMGGVPKYVVISVGVPGRAAGKTLKKILYGAKKICDKFGVKIAGGDTNKSPRLVIDTAIIGEIEKRRLALRSGARLGDLIFVTGELGLGRMRHLDFIPRVKEARTLVSNFRINSMIDISDGLSLDLYRLASASRTGAVIYRSLIPLADRSKSVDDAISYGEDFELLFTLSIKEARKLIKYVGKRLYPPVTLIGEIVPKSKGLSIVGDEGRVTRLKPKGYKHF